MANMKKLKFDHDIYETIRRNINKYRKEKGMTSEELSQLVDLSHDYVRQIQCKNGKGFSVETLYRISVALNVSLDDLIKKDSD